MIDAGKVLREYRERAGYSMDQIAEYAGVSVSTYRKYETDGGSIRLDTMIKLSKLYEVDIEQLIRDLTKGSR